VLWGATWKQAHPRQPLDARMATALLPRFLESVRMEQVVGMPVRYGEMWLSYLAAEIYGAADTCIDRHRPQPRRHARILERQMYEMTDQGALLR
jgi:hypothetical protein